MFSLSAVDNCGWPSWCLPATDLNPGAGPPHQSATFNVSGRPQNRLPSHFSDGLSAFGSNYCQEHVLQPTNSDIYHSGVPNDALGADYAVHSLYHDRDSEARTIAISNREPSAFPIQDNESSSTQGPIVRPVVASQATVDAAKKKRRGEAPFACPHCPNSFTTKKNRNYHILSHMGVRPFGCDVCQLLFRAKGDLSRHKKSKKHALQAQSEGAGRS
ncbi:hypothetical protein AB1N83_007889 [Pleurotus pulmonarius]